MSLAYSSHSVLNNTLFILHFYQYNIYTGDIGKIVNKHDRLATECLDQAISAYRIKCIWGSQSGADRGWNIFPTNATTVQFPIMAST